MRDNVTALALPDDGSVPDLTRKPRAARAEIVDAPDVRRVPVLALTVAARLCDGDLSRLRINDDGSVTISNASRVPQRERGTRDGR